MVSRPPIVDAPRKDILTMLIEMYLNDTGFEERSRSVVQSRGNRITGPTGLRNIVGQFINGSLTLTQFREQIERSGANPLGSDTDTWGIKGRNFTEALKKLADNHDREDSRAANKLHELLTGLNINNIGQRIEDFHSFLVEEEQRFREEGKPAESNVAPGYSALIISLFAYWLNDAAKPTIYYQHVGRGLKMLLDAGILTRIKGLRVVHDRVEVQSKDDHLAFQTALEALVSIDKRIKTTISTIEPFWVDRFMLWLVNHPYEFDNITKVYTEQRAGRLIDDEPLGLIEEAQLREAINELRRRILVDEQLVRRIYHALLAGHVILTGPPGTGKTELARLIPELLWQGNADDTGLPSAYTARIVTATDEWSVHTLLGSIVPRSADGQISYTVQYGYLTDVLRRNWLPDPDKGRLWRKQRITSYTAGKSNGGSEQEFRGQWLVIDEFNRAPIDLALGEVLTTLSAGGGMLNVPTDDGDMPLHLPHDFRIIGTLNSFDRNYLNQISEALKRRFSFIEILPPTRQQRDAEQGVVLHATLNNVSRLSKPGTPYAIGEMAVDSTGMRTGIVWHDIVHVVFIGVYIAGNHYQIVWDNERHAFKQMFEAAWRIFEVIRIYRQLGTAQAITLFQQILIAGFAHQFTEADQWYETLDNVLCDVIADQLQVLMPDELNVLYRYVNRASKNAFIDAYHAQLTRLFETSERRLRAQLEALSMVVSSDGRALLSEVEVEKQVNEANPRVANDVMAQLFYLDEPSLPLPQFARRLRVLRAERGL